MIKQHEIISMRKGSGSLKYYKYYANGIRLKTKSAVLEAINLKVSNVMRVEKDGLQTLEKFNYKTNDFEETEPKEPTWFEGKEADYEQQRRKQKCH